MTKFNFLSLMVLAVIGLPALAVAQPRMGAWADTADVTRNNFYIDYAGGRVSISAPASIAGIVTHTISNDGGGSTNEWGGSIQGLSSPILNVNIVKADPYEACGTLTNASAINGNIALIKRGNCEFGAKALAAENAGAVAVIIVNNLSGPPVGMGAGAQGSGVTIPVIMVSDIDGAAIETALGSGVVTMSMTTWSNGYANDLGFVDRGLSLWHAYSVPFTQVSGGTSSLQYNGIVGAVIGNFGSGTSTNTKLKATLKWTPTGGSTTVVRADSMTISGNFAP
ncbi:MAG TPA: PA domain-containing protein, partial [Flavipsychrobacter sp.]|nr:PA domain-containing protein [Flavipsychrobacter sp.]